MSKKWEKYSRKANTRTGQDCFHVRRPFSTGIEVWASRIKRKYTTENDFETHLKRCEAYHPFFFPMVNTARKVVEDYVIEGCDFTPEISSRMRNEVIDMKIAFFGFSEMNESHIADFTHENSWMRDKEPEKIRRYVESYRAISRYNKEECERLSIRYFDVSKNLLEALEEAYQYLMK